MISVRECVNHLRHCIQEQEGIELSEKSVRDIELTFHHLCVQATSGMKENMNMWRSLYYDAKKQNDIYQAWQLSMEKEGK